MNTKTMNMVTNSQNSEINKKTAQLDKLLRKVTVKVSSHFKNVSLIEEGSGVLYRTSKSSKFDYVFTALHCIRGEYKKDFKSYEYSLNKINKIEIKHKHDPDDIFFNIDITNIKNIIEFEKGDFAILLIDKKFGNTIEKKGRIPEYYILQSKNYTYNYFRACGYPKIFPDEFWTTDAKIAPNGSHKNSIELVIDNIADDKVLEKIGGFSGSGFFISFKPILAGFALKLKDKSAYTNRLFIKRISKININSLLQNRDKSLELINVIDDRSKIYIENENEVINYTKIKIETIELNLWNAIERVKLDLKDDWFPDPQKFEDVLRPQYIYDKLRKYVNNQKYLYRPEEAVHFNVPKRGFTTRTATEINIIDRVVYQMLVDFMIDDFNEIIENNVYSARFDTRNRDNSFFINPVEQWKKFSFQINEELNNEYPFLVVADITSFYDNINIEILTKKIKHINHLYLDVSKEKKEKYDIVIGILRRLLIKWSRNGLKVGIPQNKDASTFLANLLLAEVDKTLINNGIKYYRFNDDIRILCKTKFDAQKALVMLINELNKIHLNLNASKTKILNITANKDEVEKYLPKSERTFEQINSLLRAKRARDVQVAIRLTYENVYKESLKDNFDEDLKNRYFNFYIERLQRFARNPFLKELFPFEEVAEYLVELLVNEPWNTDKIIRYLKALEPYDNVLNRIKDLVIDENRNIYNWQSFLMWHLLAYHKFYDYELIKYAKNTVDNPNQNKRPETSAISIYLASVAKPYFISNIKTSFDENKFTDHFTQRNVLISMKKINYKEFTESAISPAYKGLMIRLNGVTGDYIKRLPVLKPDEIYRDLPNKIISL